MILIELGFFLRFRLLVYTPSEAEEGKVRKVVSNSSKNGNFAILLHLSGKRLFLSLYLKLFNFEIFLYLYSV